MYAEKAATLESTSAVAMAEVGQQCLLRNKVKDAQRYYKVRAQCVQVGEVERPLFFLQREHFYSYRPAQTRCFSWKITQLNKVTMA